MIRQWVIRSAAIWLCLLSMASIAYSRHQVLPGNPTFKLIGQPAANLIVNLTGNPFGNQGSESSPQEKTKSSAIPKIDDAKIRQLINDLDSEEYKVRDSALKRLTAIGLPAAKPLIDATLNDKRSFEVRNRCLKILIGWSQTRTEKEITTIAKLVDSVPEKSDPNSDSLRRLREHYLLNLSSDPKVVLEKLKGAGIEISENFGGSLQVSAFKWGGSKHELAYFSRINGAFSLSTSPEMLGKVIDYLEPDQVKELYVTRAPSSSKFRRFPATPEKINDPVIQKLTQFTSLRRLDFTWVRISNTGFSLLAKCRNLESLTLNSEVSDADLKFMESLSTLKHCRFHNSFEIKGEGLKHFRKLKQLERLDLFYTHATGDSLRHLTELPKLKSLYAPQSNMNDEGMAHLAKIKSLEELKLDNTRVTNRGLATINKMPNLSSLSLTSGSFSNTGVKNLLSLPKLRSVTVSAGLITEEIKDQLQKAGATFQVSGQFFKPNSNSEYQAIEILLERGLQVSQYPRPNNLSLQLFPNQWKGRLADLQEIAKLNEIEHLRLYIYGNQPPELIDQILKVDLEFEIRILPDPEDAGNVLPKELAERLRKRFPNPKR